ncbi:MAG: SDR family NAD(P)-dependent oxidoreductase [Solirubrobacterales bacterium]
MSHVAGGSSTRTAIVTGGGGAEARAAVELLASSGVHILCVSDDGVPDLPQSDRTTGAEHIATHADLSVPTEAAAVVDQANERWGGVDLLVCAGALGVRPGPLAETSVEDYRRAMALSVRGTFLTLKYALPVMMRQEGGRVVVLTSVGALRGQAGAGVRAATHHALRGMTMNVAHEYAAHGIRTHLLCVGSTPAGAEGSAEDEGRAVGQPQDRAPRPEEVSEVVTWLLLESPDHLNGQVVVVDGGRAIG